MDSWEKVLGPRTASGGVSSRFKLLAVAGLFVLFNYRTTRTVVDPDMWHMMSLAREIFSLHYVPWVDTFAYTPTVKPVVHHEWGAGVIAYAAASGIGSTGIVLLRSCLTWGLAFCCWRAVRHQGATVVGLSFLLPIGIILVDEGFSPVRAQMYSFLFTAIMLHWLNHGRFEQPNLFWNACWLVLFTIWVNIHAGFLVGAGLFAIYWLEQWLRGLKHAHLLSLGIIMIPLTTVNPYGLYFHHYLWTAVRMDRPHVAEWQSVWNVGSPRLICLALSAILLGYAVKNVTFRRAIGVSVVCATLAVSITSRRMLPIYSIAWAIYVPGWMEGSRLSQSLHRLWSELKIPVILVWMFVVGVVGYFWIQSDPFRIIVPGQAGRTTYPSVIYPVSAVEYLRKSNVPTNLMVPFDVGAYVSWKLHPLVNVSMDSRYEVAYAPALANENYQLYMAEGNWQSLVSRHGTDAILVPSRLPLSAKIENLAGWHRVYHDAYYSIYAPHESQLPVQSGRSKAYDGTIP